MRHTHLASGTYVFANIYLVVNVTNVKNDWHNMIITHDTHLVETLWSYMTCDTSRDSCSVITNWHVIWYSRDNLWYSRRDLMTWDLVEICWPSPVIFLRVSWLFCALVIQCSLRSQGSETYKMVVKDSILRTTINKKIKHAFIFKIPFKIKNKWIMVTTDTVWT